MVAPVGHALAAAQPFATPLDPHSLFDTLSALVRKYQVPGAQLAIHHGGETVAIEVGELEYRTGRPVTWNAAFPIGSISKTFTATVAMTLVADGDLDLDAPLGEHLPELGDLGNGLTLRQVLSHTGGLAEGPEPAEALASIRRYILDNCRSQNLVLPPGTGFSYSNIGYILVGHLIETITGMSWWDAMELILLRPLRIEPTFIGKDGRSPLDRPLATGHSVNTALGRTRPVTQSLTLAEAPAGGLAMSAMDLVTLGLTQLDDRGPALLPTVYAGQMRQSVSSAKPFGLADGWGLGLAIFRHADAVWVGHDGNADGTACYFRVEPVNGSVVAFTSNANIGVCVWRELLPELCRAGLPLKSYSTVEALGRPTAPPPGCLGSYRNGDTEYSVTLLDNGNHCLTIDGEAVAWLRFHEGLIYSQQDMTSGQWTNAGRFLRNPVTGDLDGILVNGRVGSRQSVTGENMRCLITTQTASC
ncbi:MAG TPA: serine hydrolase domain-containing protein [Pseudonocardiaceae bacterium]|nr:serine hydrolase domain-containing protein [Pseudonocardiaceae bacterium]